MAGEFYAFSRGFDVGFMMKHDLQNIYNRNLPLTLLTGSKQMFDVITKTTHTSEKEQIINISAAREVYGKSEISKVGLFSSEHNIADRLTKMGYCKALDNVLRYCYDSVSVQ